MYVKCIKTWDWVEYRKNKRPPGGRRLYEGQIFKTTNEWDERYCAYLEHNAGWFLVRCSNLDVLTYKGLIEEI